MKKLLAVLLAAASLSMTACGGAVVTNALIDETKPWKNAAGYEKSVYTVERYKMKKSGKETVYDGQPIATGSLTIAMTETGGSAGTTEALTDFSLTYSDDERNGANRGLTDTMTASCAFLNTGCAPLSSHRKVTLAPRDKETVNNSYEITADYADKKSSVMQWRGEEKSMAINPQGQFFDNEQLYVVLRAFQDVKPKSSVSFTLSHLFDAHSKNAYSTYGISLSLAEEKETLFIGDWACDYATLDADGKPSIESDGKGSAKLECIKGSLQLSGSQPGPAQTVYFSNIPFRIDDDYSTKKVIVRIVTKEYSAAEETYNTVYTLSAYTTEKAA